MVMDSSPNFKSGHPDTELLWAVGPVNHIKNIVLVKITKCQTKFLMFSFNPTNSSVAEFGKRAGWLTALFFTQSFIGNKPDYERNLCAFFYSFSYIIVYIN